MLAERRALVVAGLTVLQAYRLAEQRGAGVKLTPMGSFPDWDWIRGALVWLGCSDPADTRASVLDDDLSRGDLLAVMTLWDAAVGAEAVDVGEIARRADAAGSLADTVAHAVIDLRDKLIEVTGRGEWSGRSVGWWLKRHVDRVIGGRCFRRAPADRWVLVTGQHAPSTADHPAAWED